eukprot:2534831-Ditylum_brightwellii.AAC.1
MKQQCQAEVWDIQHMKGYQKGGDLEREAVLNNVTDVLATGARQSLSWNNRNTSSPLYLVSKISVGINNKMITRELQEELQQAFASRDLRAHMNKNLSGHRTKLTSLIR